MLRNRRVLVLLGLLLLAGISTARGTRPSKLVSLPVITGGLYRQRESVDYYSYRPLPTATPLSGATVTVLAG